MGVGFIRDKLEIKFLILYIAARVSEPLPLEGMQELTMCDDGIDYFDFSECLNDLVQTEHLRLTEEGRYAITPKGLKTAPSASPACPIPCGCGRTGTSRNTTRSCCGRHRCRGRPSHGKTAPTPWN